jgi:hypothetical protein
MPKASAKSAYEAAIERLSLVFATNSSPESDRDFVEESHTAESLAHIETELKHLIASLGEKDLGKVRARKVANGVKYDVHSLARAFVQTELNKEIDAFAYFGYQGRFAIQSLPTPLL